MSKDLDKTTLYQAVKTLLELKSSAYIHLNQSKLFTLYSIAFQYMLYQSTKKPGLYIIRVEDSSLADKLSKKSKDISTRKFLQKILLPRKLKYHKSTFYIDFFHLGSWNMTKDLPPEKIQGAIVVKNTSSKPMSFSEKVEEEEDQHQQVMSALPEDYYVSSLKEVCPHIIAIAYDNELEGFTPFEFDFISNEQKPKTMNGVTFSKDINWDQLK